MKLLDCLSGDQGEIPHLLARLSHRLAGMAHFGDQFLRRFSILTQEFGSLFKRAQHLTDTTLFVTLDVG